MALILDGTDGITQPTITTAFGVPAGTTAQRPSVAEVGMIRFNTTLGALENFTPEGWVLVNVIVPILTSVSGEIFQGEASTLTLSGTDFGTGAGAVRFTSGATVENVTVTPASEISATVTVPSAIFNLNTGSTVTIQFIREGGGVSNAVNKTVATLPAVQYLVIAGGGGGGATNLQGNQRAGGGGAGGYRNAFASETSGGGSSTESPLTIAPATNYTVTVGAGGGSNANGSNSVFSAITSLGGGKGGSTDVAPDAPNSGGSGGGGGAPVTTGAAGTTGQGFAGGNSTGFDGQGGGGGGAGAVGASPGAGGAGLSSSITGSAVTRAGGGGGSRSAAGGAGGGGAGANTGGGFAGAGNTGGGGGGAFGGGGGAGGSGVVILRYPSTLTITNPGGGLTFSTATVGGDKATTFTAGTGNIQFN